MAHRLKWCPWGALLLLAAGCTVPVEDLSGKACDEQHACLAGYACVSGACQAEAPGSDAGTPVDAALPPAPDAGGRDAGEPDAGAAVDAGVKPDAATPPDAGHTGCQEGATRSCGSSVGECQPGNESCADGGWGSCLGGTGPAEESCDGKDNDCDGATDEVLDHDGDGYGVDVACPNGSGDCDDFDPDVHPGASDDCNGIDDDCDGATDAGSTGTCAAGSVAGACTLQCVGTSEAAALLVCNDTCSATVCQLPEESCNDVDDDCDGETDEGMAGGIAYLDLGGQAPEPVQLAGLPGYGFLAAWQSGSEHSLKLARVPSGTLQPEAPVVVAAQGLAGVAAVTASHLVWGQSGGLAVQALQHGRPAGSILSLPTTFTPQAAAACDWDPAKGESAVVGAAGTEALVATFAGTGKGSTEALALQESTLAGSGDLALVRNSADGRLVVYQAATALNFALDPASGGGWGRYSPAALAPCDSPAGAAGAVVFRGSVGASSAIYIGRALAAQLASPDFAAASGAGSEVSEPAVAALGGGDYLVAWIQGQTSTKALVTTVRISWSEASGWSSPSVATMLGNPHDMDALVGSLAVAADGARYLSLFHSPSTKVGDELVARTVCPANYY